MIFMTVRPLADLLRIAVAPLIWFLHLSAVYAAEAMICSGILNTWSNIGGIVIVLTMIALLGLAVTGVVIARSAEQGTNWLRRASLILTYLSAIGVVWTSLPSSLLPSCATAAIGTELASSSEIVRLPAQG